MIIKRYKSIFEFSVSSYAIIVDDTQEPQSQNKDRLHVTPYFHNFHQNIHGTWVNGPNYLAHLIKWVKYVFFHVKIFNMNQTQLIQRVKCVNQLN